MIRKGGGGGYKKVEKVGEIHVSNNIVLQNAILKHNVVTAYV